MTEQPVEWTSGTVDWGRGHVRHARVPDWVLDADISAQAVRLYAILGRYADDGGTARISKEKLRKRCRCSRSTVDRSMDELAEAGALDVHLRLREDDGKAANEYLLHWAPPEERRDGDLDPDGGTTPHGRPMPTGHGWGVRPRASIQSSYEQSSRSNDARASSAPPNESGPPVPPVVLVDGQNLPFNALRDECGIDEASPRCRQVGIALNGDPRKRSVKGIRELFWIEALRTAAAGWADEVVRDAEEGGTRFEAALEQEVHRKAGMYRERRSWQNLSPTALRDHWLDLERAPAPKRRLTGDDVRRMQA